MNLLPGWMWLMSKATRCTSPAVSAPDPADMGTAFGLDASMEPLPDARPLPTSRPEPRAPWSQRLVRRPQR